VPNCRFNDVEFTRSKLIGIDWTTTDSSGVNRALFSVSFEDCVLDYCSFYGLTVAKTKLTRCSAIGVELSEADLRETDCSGTDFAQARFSRANLERANFVGALNYGIDPLDCRIKGARFSLPEAALLLTSLGVVIED
jgi:fluoroquinolone resistance protein